MPKTEDSTRDATPKTSLKEKLMDALRKTGHVSEQGLETVAETAAAIVLSGKFGE